MLSKRVHLYLFGGVLEEIIQQKVFSRRIFVGGEIPIYEYRDIFVYAQAEVPSGAHTQISKQSCKQTGMLIRLMRCLCIYCTSAASIHRFSGYWYHILHWKVLKSETLKTKSYFHKPDDGSEFVNTANNLEVVGSKLHRAGSLCSLSWQRRGV